MLMFWLLDFNPFVAFLAASASMTASAASAVLAAWIGRTWEVLMARGARAPSCAMPCSAGWPWAWRLGSGVRSSC